MKITLSELMSTTLVVAFLASALLLNVHTSSSAGTYDPWADYNGDGIINIQDVGPLAAGWLATGNPTRNVTITGHANKLAYSVSDRSVAGNTGFWSGWIDVTGYSKMTVCIFSSPEQSNDYELDAANHSHGHAFLVDTQIDFGNGFVRTYDVPNQEIAVFFTNNGMTVTLVSIDVYVVA